MKRFYGITSALMLCLAVNLTAQDAKKEAQPAPKKEEKQEKPKLTKEQAFSKENIAKISETYGHFIYKNLENPILQLNYDSVVKGLQSAKAGKAAPMTEQEYEEAIALIQEYSFQEMALKNLKTAEEFLAKNLKEKGVKEVEKGKLQTLVLQEGKGDTVGEDKSVVLHYTGRYADGKTFGSSQESGEPISIVLSQTIPGFRKGILGMKVGEKRRLFIHPDLGYGTTGQLLPNALLIFDIEVVRLDPLPTPSASTEDADSEDMDDDSDDSDDDSDDSEE